MERILDVFIDTKKVGYLIEENNIWSFQCDQDWLDDPYVKACALQMYSRNVPNFK